MVARKLKIGIVGCGAIGSTLAKLIQKKFSGKIRVAALCDLDPEKAAALGRQIRGARAVSLDALIRSCDLVVEAASAKVSFDIARQSLLKKRRVLVMSVGGVLGREKTLFSLAKKNGSGLYFPSGAVCGLDGIRALSLERIDRITLTTVKPPQALKGADYLVRHGIDVDSLDGEKTVFEGGAFDAVRAFPQNINVVALLMLAAGGQVEPRVRIVASSRAQKNTHRIEVISGAARLEIACENEPSPDNPKTSYLAILSALAVIAGILDPVKIGN